MFVDEHDEKQNSQDRFLLHSKPKLGISDSWCIASCAISHHMLSIQAKPPDWVQPDERNQDLNCCNLLTQVTVRAKMNSQIVSRSEI